MKKPETLPKGFSFAPDGQMIFNGDPRTETVDDSEVITIPEGFYLTKDGRLAFDGDPRGSQTERSNQ